MSRTTIIIGVVLIVLLFAALIAGGCGAWLGASSSPGVTQPAGPTHSDSPAIAVTPSPIATPGADGELVASDSDLTMTVALDRAEVAPGDSITIAVTIHNARSVAVGLDCGTPATMYALVPLPVDPGGREWDGIAGEFKNHALSVGFLGGPPEAAPRRVDATVKPCREKGVPFTLDPGQTAHVSLTWTAELIDGVPAPPGDVAFRVSVGHYTDHGPSPSYPPGLPRPSWVMEQLTVDGTIRIAGDAPKVVTVGQALDAILADRRFAAWLSEQPRTTWRGANVRLMDFGAAQGIAPAGWSWMIDLFREAGAPRRGAVGFVDPLNGQLRNMTFCTGGLGLTVLPGPNAGLELECPG